MGKMSVMAVMLVGLLGAAEAYAAAVDIPTVIIQEMMQQSDPVGLCADVYGDFLIKRQLKFKEGPGRVDFKGNAAALKVGGPFLRGDVYAKIGMMQSPKLVADDTTRFSDGFMYSVGMNTVVYELQNAWVFADGKFNAIPKMNLDSLQDYPFLDEADLRYQQWQIAVGMATHIDAFTVYAGVFYSEAEARVRTVSSGLTSKGLWEQKEAVGVVAGLSLPAHRDVSIGVEGRLLAEQAVTVSLGYKF